MSDQTPTPSTGTTDAGASGNQATQPPATPPAKAGDTPAAPPAGTQGKPGTEPTNPDTPPEITLAKPDGSLLSDDEVSKITEFAKANGYSQEQANKLLERESVAATSRVDEQSKAVEALSIKWIDEAKADAEIGGDKFEESAEMAKRVAKRFGSEKFFEFLNNPKNPYGNHPELIRTFARIGRAMEPEKLVMPGAKPVAERNLADVIYSKPPQQKES